MSLIRDTFQNLNLKHTINPHTAKLSCVQCLAISALLYLGGATHAGITSTGGNSPLYDGASDPWDVGETLYIGYTDDGSLDIDHGSTVNDPRAFIGTHGTIANANVSGPGSSWNHQDNLILGYYGTGSLTIQDGGVVNAKSSYIAYESDSGVGTATVSGPGSAWNNTANMIIANAGTGSLTVKNGGSVNNVDGYIGYNYATAVATATVTDPDSTWTNTGSLTVGEYGLGTLNIENGGAVHVGDDTETRTLGSTIQFNNGTLNTGGYIGSLDRLLGSGTVYTSGLVTDTDLVFNAITGLQQQLLIANLPGQNITMHVDASQHASRGSMGAGWGGVGSLSIADGLEVASTNGYIGFGTNADGGAAIEGAGSAWNIADDLYIGYAGAGTLSINNGATINNESGYVGRGRNSNGESIISGPGSLWNNTGALFVGVSGEGSLTIQDGGLVTSTHGSIGARSDGAGAVTVTGQGSAWNNTGELYVGSPGTGTLTILNGGMVNNTSSFVGYNTKVGIVTVSGQDSVWNISGGLNIGRYDYAQGTLNINSQGTVNVSHDTWVGDNDLGDSHIYFQDGTLNTRSLLAAANRLIGVGIINTRGLVTDVDLFFNADTGLQQQIVLNHLLGQSITINLDARGQAHESVMGAGWGGDGTLTIADGMTVTSATGRLGHHEDSNGSATVAGPGSAWHMTDFFIVGHKGTGTLNITGGAAVYNGAGHIAQRFRSTGTVTVSGTGSVWNTAGTMQIGRNGHGTLNINHGGTVGVSQGITLATTSNGTGILNLAGGVLDLNGSDLIRGSGNGLFHFIDGTLKDAGTVDLLLPLTQDGGTLAPGGSIGQTDIIGGYALNSGTVEIELGGFGSPHDLLTATGDIDIAAIGSILDLKPLGPMSAGTYTIIQSHGGTIDGVFQIINPYDIDPSLFDVHYTSNTVMLTLHQDLIPEPGTLGLLAVAGMGLIRRNKHDRS